MKVRVTREELSNACSSLRKSDREAKGWEDLPSHIELEAEPVEEEEIDYAAATQKLKDIGWKNPQRPIETPQEIEEISDETLEAARKAFRPAEGRVCLHKTHDSLKDCDRCGETPQEIEESDVRGSDTWKNLMELMELEVKLNEVIRALNKLRG